MTDEAEYDAIGGQVYVDRALAGLDKYRKSVEQFVKEGDKAMKTRILPKVGEEYVSRHDGVVVEVVDVERKDGKTNVRFSGTGTASLSEYNYNLDGFWAHYKILEGEADVSGSDDLTEK